MAGTASDDGTERTLTGVLTAHPEIRDAANGNKIALLQLRPAGREDTHSATVGIGRDDRSLATAAALYGMAPGDPIALRGHWTKTEWKGPTGQLERWNFEASEASRHDPGADPATAATDTPAPGSWRAAFRHGYMAATGQAVVAPTGGRMVDHRAPDYDPVPPRPHNRPAPPATQQRPATTADGLPESTLVGTLAAPVAHRRAEGGDRIAVMRIRPDGRGGTLEATFPLRRASRDREAVAFVSNLIPGDRVSMTGLWHLQDSEVDGRRRTIREFRASGITEGPPQPEPRTAAPEPRTARPPRPAVATSAIIQGVSQGPAETLGDGRIAISIREASAWKGSAKVTIDTEQIGMPLPVAAAVLASPPGSRITARGEWHRAAGGSYTFAATHVTSEPISAAWAMAGLAEPPPPPVRQPDGKARKAGDPGM